MSIVLPRFPLFSRVRKIVIRTMATVGDYGTWKSPISSAVATESAVSFQELHVDRAPGKEGLVYWTELRFEEGGRYITCSSNTGQETPTDWTSKDLSVRTRVHEYGGGSFCAYNETLYFTNYKDQRLYAQNTPSGAVEALSAENTHTRHADSEFHPKHGLIYAVCEDHGKVHSKEAKEASNYIIAFDPASKRSHVLASGCDFYSSPRVSSDGKRIAWVQWKHPNMPWDSTELVAADLSGDGRSVVEGSVQHVAAGDNVSYMHPRWTTDNQLIYIGDQSEWWNIYHVTPGGEHVNLHPADEEVGGPHWQFSTYSYDVDPSGSGNIVTTFSGVLGVLNINTKEYRALDTGFKSHSFVQYGSDGNIYCVASSPVRFSCVIRVNPKTSQVDVLRESKKSTLDKGYFSVPEKINWKTANEETAHGVYYPPQNKDFTAPAGTLPPLLVKVHGGPTSQCREGLKLGYQYFTSRGFAILDVDYRGSTGYGKTYRHRLRNSWGICDVEDCSTGAVYLADTGRADANKLCIDGGSAGGYTTLACLAFTDVFKAGASHYGVADCSILAAETHKFESRYLDLLIAPFNVDTKPVYDARSPIKHIEKINCALALFQGDEDEVVPPNQAVMMYDAVKEKGLPCCLVMFKGEQHGFRKAENIQKALDGEFYFFSRVFGFKAAGSNIDLQIDNL